MNRGRPTKRKRTKFGERLNAARKAKEFSLKEVAELLGMSVSGYAAWERDRIALYPEQIEQIATILEIPVHSLFGDTPVKKSSSTSFPQKPKRKK